MPSTLYFDGEFSSVSTGSRPPTIGETTMFWSSTLWSWRHMIQVHESSQPITRCKAWQTRAGYAVDRFWTGCHVDAMAAVWQNHIGKNIKITFKLRPSIHNRQLVHGGIKIPGRYNPFWNSAPFFLKRLGSSKLHFDLFLLFVNFGVCHQGK